MYLNVVSLIVSLCCFFRYYSVYYLLVVIILEVFEMFDEIVNLKHNLQTSEIFSVYLHCIEDQNFKFFFKLKLG